MKKKAPPKKTNRKLVDKPFNAGNFSRAMYFQKIRNALRNAFRYWIPMQNALKAASRPSQSSNARLKTEYQCAKCKKWFARKDVEIDHIFPAGALSCYEDIVPFIKNLTAEDIESYQILCKPDHLKKSIKERADRKLNK